MDKFTRRSFALLATSLMAIPARLSAELAQPGRGAIEKSQSANCDFSSAISKYLEENSSFFDALVSAQGQCGEALKALEEQTEEESEKEIGINSSLFDEFRSFSGRNDEQLKTNGDYKRIASELLEDCQSILSLLTKSPSDVAAADFARLIKNFAAMSLLNAAVVQFPTANSG